MSHVRKAALPLLVVALGAALAACSRNEDAADAATTTPVAAPETTPATAPASEDVHAFQIGTLQAAALRDGGISVPNDNAVFGVGLTPEEVASVLAGAGLETDMLHLSVQPLLVRDGGRVYLFDAGAGQLMGDNAGRLDASLQAAGVEPGQVTDVFISHAHGDHVGGLVDAAGALAFPNATIHVSQPEWEDLQAQASGEGEAMAGLVAAITPKVSTFAPDAELVPGLVQSLSTPGHTPGHVSFRIGGGQDRLLYVGDLVHHPVVSVQRPQWTIKFDRDAAAGAAMRGKTLEAAADSGERLYAVHLPFPGLGRIERGGDGQLAWVAE